MVQKPWNEVRGEGPLVAVAVHAGHEVRADIAALMALSDEERLREEDPHTDEWAVVAPTRIVATYSRFQVDLNRPRSSAVYRTPQDAWGLKVWKRAVPEEVIEAALAEYDAFYENMRTILGAIEQRHGRFVIFDLHSYNHRRAGPRQEPAPAAENPQVNIGTGTMNLSRWSAVVQGFMNDLRSFEFPGGRLDVRENVKFRGGHFSRWVHETFPGTGCAIAIEFKKFFMDEWSGQPDHALIRAISAALRSTVPGVLAELTHP